jgi:hypothetical protein
MQVVPVRLEVEGDRPAPIRLVPDADRPKEIDGYTVRFETPDGLAALRSTRLVFAIERAGKPVDDLEHYLGASGHLIVVSEDRARFVHSHPLESPAVPGQTPRAGPRVSFTASFPAPGRYKAWGQFQHHGKVLTFPFTFDVAPPGK